MGYGYLFHDNLFHVNTQPHYLYRKLDIPFARVFDSRGYARGDWTECDGCDLPYHFNYEYVYTQPDYNVKDLK